jgi:hypothetical protein
MRNRKQLGERHFPKDLSGCCRSAIMQAILIIHWAYASLPAGKPKSFCLAFRQACGSAWPRSEIELQGCAALFRAVWRRSGLGLLRALLFQLRGHPHYASLPPVRLMQFSRQYREIQKLGVWPLRPDQVVKFSDISSALKPRLRLSYAAFRQRIRPRPKRPVPRSKRVAGSGTAAASYRKLSTAKELFTAPEIDIVISSKTIFLKP